jgi:hypothetical protein
MSWIGATDEVRALLRGRDADDSWLMTDLCAILSLCVRLSFSLTLGAART